MDPQLDRCSDSPRPGSGARLPLRDARTATGSARFGHGRGIGALVVAMALASASQAAPFPRIPDSVPIDCANNPFGSATMLQREAEPLYLIGGSSGQMFEEYRTAVDEELPPLTRVYRSDLLQGSLPHRPFQKAASADLDGDGRDEIIVAFSDNSDVHLGVYRRTPGLSPSATLAQDWQYSGESVDADSIDIQAGDFDGSADGKQELAVSWKLTTGPNAGGTRIIVLNGGAGGLIADADNAPSGNWVSNYASSVTSRLAVGDFLLDGRDQFVLFGANGTNELRYDLIEYQTPWPTALPVAGGSSGGMGSTQFLNSIPFFRTDDDISPLAPPVLSIQSLLADGGDLVDSAAAELIVHVMFETRSLAFSYQYYALGQRLLHFDTTRDVANAITGVSLGNAGTGYDSSRLVESYNLPVGGDTVPPPAPAIAATIADVGDGQPSVITVRAGRMPNSPPADQGGMRWSAFKARVRTRSGFLYQNAGSGSGYTVKFSSTGHGDRITYNWDFGDGSSSPDQDPTHVYSTLGNRTVKLTVTAADGSTDQYSATVPVNGGIDPDAQGFSPPYVYSIDANASFTGRDDTSLFGQNSLVSVAVGDIDNDGMPEVLTVGRDIIDGIYRYVWKPATGGTFSFGKTADGISGVSDLQVLASDFDGNSLRATISTDCRHVSDLQLRTLVWLPPYFGALQADAYKIATFGQSTSGGSSTEQRSGSYYENDISGYFGAEYGAAIFALEIEASVKVTAGHNWQSGHGSIHGYEREYSINDGANQAEGDALVEAESHGSDCYAYDVSTSDGVLPDSALRICSPSAGETSRIATDAQSWNTLSDETTPVLVPMNWVPLQRDWASLALFHPVTASTSSGFVAGSAPAMATDGLFSTAAETAAATVHPYLEIDLGDLRDISAVRVFPKAGQVRKLWGYRLYASATPFAGSGVPSGTGVASFQQDTGSESVYSSWNIWTRNPADPAEPLQARYLRLQYPGAAQVALAVAEIQAFGDTHSEPPMYPEGVCDPVTGDGSFLARVWNPVGRQYQNIEMRGNLMWTGADYPGNPPIQFDTGVTLNGAACVNGQDNPPFPAPPHPRVTEYRIWENRAIGASGSPFWDLDTSEVTSSGNYTSIDSSTRVGIEFDAKAGFGVKLMAGAAYEFTTGVTKDSQSSISWGNGLAVGGEMEGFQDPAPGVVALCQYYPRPYAFSAREYSNAGFAQDMYVTDYVLQQLRHGSQTWQRSAVPPACSGDNDTIFASGFE